MVKVVWIQYVIRSVLDLATEESLDLLAVRAQVQAFSLGIIVFDACLLEERPYFW